jgi:two-component system, NarL family, nitrate/nitrite response regulator NarL
VQAAVRVAVVDDHPLFREGVAGGVKASPELDLVAVGASRDDAVRIAQDMAPDVVLLDIQLPGSGLEAARAIVALGRGTRVVMLTASEQEEDVSAALETGASGYILKGISAADLVRTVLAVHKGNTYVTPDLAARMLRSLNRRAERKPEKDICSLTPREEDILDCVAIGQTNKEIAIRLNIGEKTVKHYMTNIMHKLQVRNRVEAALKAKGRSARASADRQS